MGLGDGPTWSGEGQKVFSTQGAKLSQEPSAPKTSFALVQTPSRTTARGLLLAGSKRPVAPSPNHFSEIFRFSGDFPGPWLLHEKAERATREERGKQNLEPRSSSSLALKPCEPPSCLRKPKVEIGTNRNERP